jgi:hypothetical protein
MSVAADCSYGSCVLVRKLANTEVVARRAGNLPGHGEKQTAFSEAQNCTDRAHDGLHIVREQPRTRSRFSKLPGSSAAHGEQGTRPTANA